MKILKDKILKEKQAGNIVINTFEGLKIAKLKDIIKQPADGILYDVNRDFATILTFIDDPKWINDFALSQIVYELKRQIDEKN